jgi:hypothetical protein
VTLRVVGGDEKGSLKSETVKYGCKSQGTRTAKDCAGKGQRHIKKDRPVLSSERAPHGIKNVTLRGIPYSERGKNLVVSPGWVLYTKTDWPTVRRSNIRLRESNVRSLVFRNKVCYQNATSLYNSIWESSTFR